MSMLKIPSIMTPIVTATQRLLKVAIVGVPNAGKSTLINNIMSLVVCPVSKRVHTTRVNQHASYLENETQIVFVDTPGLVNMKEIKKFAFPKDFVFGPEQSVRAADLIAVIHDLSNNITKDKLDPRIRGLLDKFPDKNSILILNKVDTIKKKETLLETVRLVTSGVVGNKPIILRKSHDMRVKEQKKLLQIDNLIERGRKRAKRETTTSDFDIDLQEHTKRMVMSAFSEEEIKENLHLLGWPSFHDVFMISALNGDGVNLLREYFVVNAKPCPWAYEEDFLTDVEPKELTIRIIKSLMLDHLPQEIPYKLEPKVEFWDKNDAGILQILIHLECPNQRYYGRVLGTGGNVIRNLTGETEAILRELLQTDVNLGVNLEQNEGWLVGFGIFCTWQAPIC